jgi:4-amino-4-deoxy-L-arabinose transferase-like glycosyltransferase
MTLEAEEQRRRRIEMLLLVSLALFKFALHLVASLTDTYGYFRDELYYLACTNHLDIGYVDQPPFSIFVLAVNRALLGDSLVMLRLLPALAGAGTVFLTGLIVRELGGRAFAILVAGLSSIVSLIYLGMFSVYTMNALDILIWTFSAYLLLRISKTKDVRLWILLGLVLGIGLLNKTSVLWLGVGLAVGLVATPWRQWLRTPWPWVAGAIAAVVFLPYVVWNIQHDLAHLEFIREATAGKYSGISRMDFVLGQFILQNPTTLPVWTVGLGFLLFSKAMREGRILGIIFIVVAAILLANGHSKPEYLCAAYGPIFAAGGVAFERWLSSKRATAVRVALVVVVACGLALAPATLAILPVPTYLAYAKALGIEPSTAENLQLSELPQFYADRFGWEEKARAVAEVYHRLSPQEQKVCRIFADNYGRCGAIDFFGRAYGLPPAIGRHNSYWIWGPGDFDGQLLIILGGDLEDHQRGFEHVEVAGSVSCQYCMPYENNLNIYVCRRLKIPLRELWPQLKHYM